MYRDTKGVDVIELSSDEDDGPHADGPAGLSGKETAEYTSARPSAATQFKNDQVFGLKDCNGNDGHISKEGTSTQPLRFFTNPESCLSPRVVDKSYYGTCGIMPRRPGPDQDKAGDLDAKTERTVDVFQSNYNPPRPFLNTSSSHIQQIHISRRFWKAGDYDAQVVPSRTPPNGLDHVRVHPKFLHSNATSHKWALGAIAELLDNAIDEVQNGATYVSVDSVPSPQDGSPMLLVQDDGGGMDPDCLRQCMSLGYSRKTAKTTIGQYGNGFKTSTMRLGADVVVFTSCLQNGHITESIGLLSYTFLRVTGKEDIVVPMLDFANGRTRKALIRTTKSDWLRNLTIILQWSPYKTEVELLNQLDSVRPHGTKIIVYNLWLNDDGELELDFEKDKQDIQLRGVPKLDKVEALHRQLTQQHIANRLQYSLRAYSSILYLKMPGKFHIILRGHIVQHLSIADDLKFPEHILYKPQVGNRDFGGREVFVITTIGFAKESPMVNVHGFNVYHKNRLIMPFWRVFHENSSRGKGVVGVLEANFMEPAHDKQDFERTPILQRLETRLKKMTIEYWDLHCELIGYQPPRQSSKPGILSSSISTAASPVSMAQGHSSQFGTLPQAVIVTGCSPVTLRDGATSSHPEFASGVHLDFRVDEQDGRAYTSSSGINFSSCAQNIGTCAAAPSTPPQPASDMGMLFNQLDIACSQTTADFKVTNSFPHGYTEGTEGCIREIHQSERSIFNNCKTEEEDLSTPKRLASEADLQNLDPVSKRLGIPDMKMSEAARFPHFQQSGGMALDSMLSMHASLTTLNTAEILEEVKQLRLRCRQYEWEKWKLELKVSELQQELKSHRKKLSQEQNIVNPKGLQ